MEWIIVHVVCEKCGKTKQGVVISVKMATLRLPAPFALRTPKLTQPGLAVSTVPSVVVLNFAQFTRMPTAWCRLATHHMHRTPLLRAASHRGRPC